MSTSFKDDIDSMRSRIDYTKLDQSFAMTEDCQIVRKNMSDHQFKTVGMLEGTKLRIHGAYEGKKGMIVQFEVRPWGQFVYEMPYAIAMSRLKGFWKWFYQKEEVAVISESSDNPMFGTW